LRDAFEYKSRNHYILVSEDKAFQLEQEYNLKQFGIKTIVYAKSSDDHPEVKLFIDKLVDEMGVSAPAIDIADSLVGRNIVSIKKRN
jgi:hypothetical protein